jgi:hypothetical protein
VILSYYRVLRQAKHMWCHGEDLRSRAASNMAAASSCRLLDAVECSLSTSPRTLATTAVVGSTSLRAGVTVGTATWSAGDASMDTTTTTTASANGMICWFMHFQTYIGL